MSLNHFSFSTLKTTSTQYYKSLTKPQPHQGNIAKQSSGLAKDCRRGGIKVCEGSGNVKALQWMELFHNPRVKDFW